MYILTHSPILVHMEFPLSQFCFSFPLTIHHVKYQFFSSLIMYTIHSLVASVKLIPRTDRERESEIALLISHLIKVNWYFQKEGTLLNSPLWLYTSLCPLHSPLIFMLFTPCASHLPSDWDGSSPCTVAHLELPGPTPPFLFSPTQPPAIVSPWRVDSGTRSSPESRSTAMTTRILHARRCSGTASPGTSSPATGAVEW